MLMETVLEFSCWHLSQARASMQTVGWPDMRFVDRARGIAVWWEAKAPGGKQSAAQHQFQLDVEACGEAYVLGPYQVLEDWAVAHGLVERLPNGNLIRRRTSPEVM